MGKVSFFNGSLTNCSVHKDVNPEVILDLIKTNKYKREIEQIRVSTKEERKRLKGTILPYVTWSGTFSYRNNGSLMEHSGLLCLDIDIYDDETLISNLKEKAKRIEEVFAVWFSPSKGLKILVKVPKEQTNEEHKRRYVAAYNYFQERLNLSKKYLDESTKDVSRACLLSWDSKLYFNPNSKIFEGKIEEEREQIKEPDYSRSATEFKEVISLVKKSNSNERINSYMKAKGFTKWTEREEAYRNHTIKRAREAVEEERKIKAGELGVFTNYKEMADKFVQIRPLYYDKAKLWWIWIDESSCWELTDETDIMIEIDQHLNEKNTLFANIKNMILESLKRAARKNSPGKIPKTWVQFKDKIVDIKTGEYIKSSPEYFTTNPIPWELGEKEDTPNMDRIFKEWVGEKYVDTLYEILAYCMLPDYPIHRIFCFVGSGMNGKTKYLDLLHNFIGGRNTTSTELDTLLNSRFEITRLHKKLACLMGETDFTTMRKTSVLKKLSGQDQIGFEYKNKDPFTDYNYAKILIATNNLPITEDKTKGFYRRWMIIDFPNEFTEKKDILSEIPDEEYLNLGKKLVRILKELIEKREFSNEGSIEQRQEKYEKNSNALYNFIEQKCEKDPSYDVTFTEFFSKFNEYCKENKHRQLSNKMVGTILGNMGFERVNKSYTDNFDEGQRTTTTKRIIVGLRLKVITEEQEVLKF